MKILGHLYEWVKWLLDLSTVIFSFPTEPPPVIQVPNNVTVTPGETAVLTCLVVSAVGYNLTWQRNGRDVRLTAPAGMRILANLSLELRSVKFSDAGEYRCVVSNEGGSSTEAVFLTVQGTVPTVTSESWYLSVFLLWSLFPWIVHLRVSIHTITASKNRMLVDLEGRKGTKLETKTSLANSWP